MADIHSNIGPVTAITPAVITATTTGNGLDLAGYATASLVISTGAIVASGNFTAKLQESDSQGSGFVDVPAAGLIGTFPAVLAADSVVKVGYLMNRRYVRCVVTLNSGTSIALAAVLVRGNPQTAPV
ncbi:hypothetical protein [Aquidulcibacter sp.]|uniref:hypothetical protein n=1 Tax=Aquidulcibacter sp. TaxID=2052990 RepID=UPI003BA5DBF7